MPREFTAEQLERIEQMGAVMDVLTIAYPLHYKAATEDEKYAASCLWAEMFADDPVEVVVAAVKSFITTDTKGFPPSIGIIKDHVLKVTTPPQKSALEAWAEVKCALKNSCYGYVEEFEKLDAPTRRIVGYPAQLREWAQVDPNTLDTVVASNFRESYGAVSKQSREQQVLPPAISEIVNLLAGKTDMKQDSAPEPKALPISVEAVVNETKASISAMPVLAVPKPLNPEQFENRRAEMLKALEAV